ncbi:hypothetical protein QYE76_008799 [Lolium multiflorum]|uniref:Ubiquitinyl hydrolase 1 n=1 Tax=Lolium multiflorum TaxID=4521 RepID=A0AAD8X2Q0_LOLMU|nr:hypothetical protein QYE76_008799 [Lolium multiflorum]
MKSGSGNQEPVNGHGQREDSKNGASDGAPSAVAAQGGADASSPSRLPAAPVGRPQERARQQAGGGSRGTNGSSSAAVGVDQKGGVPAAIPLPEPPAPSSAGSSPSTPSLDSAWPFGAGTVSSAAVDCKEVFDRLVRAQAAINEAGRGSAEEGEKNKKKPAVEQVESSHPKKALWSKLKNYFTRNREIVVREEWEMYKEHVGHQTNPIAEVFDYYRVPEDMAICLNLDAYLRFRPVYGDGECFYRSFIFSYLEQVLDRQDTHEEHRLLDTIKRVSTQHKNLGWTSSGFRRSYKEMHNCLTVVACHHSFTHCWHKLKFEVYCKVNKPILTTMNLKINLLPEEQRDNITGSDRIACLFHLKTNDAHMLLLLMVQPPHCSVTKLFLPQLLCYIMCLMTETFRRVFLCSFIPWHLRS